MHRSRFIRIQTRFPKLLFSLMIDRDQRLLDPTCCNRFWLCRRASLSDHISSPPSLSAAGQDSPLDMVDRRGRAGQLRADNDSRGSKSYRRESIAIFAYPRGDLRNPERMGRSVADVIIFLLRRKGKVNETRRDRICECLFRNFFYNRHFIRRNATFSRVYKRRLPTLLYWRQLKKSWLQSSYCGNCSR